MGITYRKMWGLVHERGLKWQDIKQEVGLSNEVIARINRNDYISLKTLEKIARFLHCEIGDLVELKDE